MGFSWQRRPFRTVLAAVVLLTVALDCKVYSSGRWFNAEPGDHDEVQTVHSIRGMNPDAYATLEANRSYRVMCDESASPYPTDLRKWDLATPQGFDPFLPAQYRTWIEQRVPLRSHREFFLDVRNEKMLRDLGVRYIITHTGVGSDPVLSRDMDFRVVGDPSSFYRVYEWRNARPPYYWADHQGDRRTRSFGMPSGGSWTSIPWREADSYLWSSFFRAGARAWMAMPSKSHASMAPFSR